MRLTEALQMQGFSYITPLLGIWGMEIKMTVAVMDAGNGGKAMDTVNGILAARCAGLNLPLQVLHSRAGFYIGTADEVSGPVSRESVEYFTTQDSADLALLTGNWTQRESA